MIEIIKKVPSMNQRQKTKDETSSSAFSRMWHYRPNVPVQTAPYFTKNISLPDIVRWSYRQWLFITERSLLLVISLISFLYFQPDLTLITQLHPDWIIPLYARNMILMIAVAGLLHLYFYAKRGQDDALRYDTRSLENQRAQFTFRNQLHDNMFWTLASGVTIWTAYEVLLFWAMANGIAPVMVFADNPILFVALIFLTPLWISFHFYWVHRVMHWGPLYRVAHALHHRNTNVGPWSGLSMHPIEHVIFFSSILIHFIIPSSPFHILFHMQHQSLTAATSHTGYEAVLIKDKKYLALGTFHHQMHHRYFDCNYGNLEMPWDKWFGSFHDGTSASHEAFKERKKALRQKPVR